MNPSWRSFLESADAVFDGASDELLHFGDAAGELRAATQQTVLVPLTHLALIEAAGEDAKSFLHGQFTSDVNHLSEGKLQHSSWCSAKGRMQASFLLWPAAGGYRMLLAADLDEAIQKRLQMFVLRDKVKITRAGDAMLALGVIDRIVKEPIGGAHRDPALTAQGLSKAIGEELDELGKLSADKLRAKREERFLRIGEA
jgi:folate-binding Fe-S cluster repair protein YgfZ